MHRNYLSDGAIQHVKNAKNMMNLTCHKTDFNITASWTFSPTSHGKEPVDGIGAVVKSRATRHTITAALKKALLSSEDFFKCTKTNDQQVMKGDLEFNRPTEAFYIKKIDVDNTLKTILETQWLKLIQTKWIEGIQSKYQSNSIGIGKVKCFQTSNSGDFNIFQLPSISFQLPSWITNLI